MAVSADEHYKRACAGIDFFAARLERTFNLFIQLSVATVGGFIWLKTQQHAEAASNVFPLVRWIIPALAIISIAQTVSDSKSWFGFRREEANLLGRPDLVPRFPRSGRIEIIRIIAMIVFAAAAFWFLR